MGGQAGSLGASASGDYLSREVRGSLLPLFNLTFLRAEEAG